MKRLVSICFFGFLLAGGNAPAAEDLVLVHPEGVTPTIVLSEDAEDQVKFAAEDLRHYLGRMTGREISMGPNAVEGSPAIFLGAVPANANLKAVVKKKELGRDGFVIDVSADQVRILGGSKFGTSYGVYDFLERVGVRWLFPGELGEVVPRKEFITVPLGQTVDQPVFSIRQMHTAWVGQEVGDWFRRSRHNRSGYYGHSHLLTNKKYGAKHPEWYAEVDGVRQVDDPNFKLCHSNEAMVETAIKEVLEEIRERKADAKERKHDGYRHLAEDYSIISISPRDGGGFCTCAECLEMGSVSDRLQIFANRIAKAVRAEFPDYSVGYYGAYSEAQDPPTVKADPGVIVFATTWTRNFFQPLTDGANSAYRNKIESFAPKCPDLGIRDFDGLSVWWGYGPLTLADIHAKDYQLYHELGVQGIITEAQSGWGLWGYHYYLLGKLWWNPRADLPALKKDYIQSAYGEASAPMTEYFKLLDQAVVHPSASVLYQMRQHLEEAAKLATDPKTKLRIDALRVQYFLSDLVAKQQSGEGTPADLTLFYRLLRSIDPNLSLYTTNRRFARTFPKDPSGDKADDTLSADELHALLGQVALEKPGKEFPPWLAQNDLRLVPLRENEAEFQPDLGMNLRFGPATLLIYAAKGDPIRISQDSKRGDFQTAYELKDPELVTIAEGVGTAAGTVLDLSAPSSGIYTLMLSPGGFYPDIEISNRWVVAKAGSTAQIIQPMGKVPKAFFFVPLGTKEFSISAKAYEPLTIDVKGPIDKPLSFSKIKQASTRYEDHHIEVPPGSDGKVWEMELGGGKKDIYLSGIPPFLASAPNRLLIPPEMKNQHDENSE